MTAGNELWVLGRQSNGKVDRISFELLAWARELTGDAPLTVILCGPRLPDEEILPLGWYGADNIVAIESDVPQVDTLYWSSAISVTLSQYVEPAALIAGADTYGRTILPCVAMQLHTGLTADCTALEWDSATGILRQTRPATGGSIMATIECATRRPQLATVRPRSRKPLEPDRKHRATLNRMTVPDAPKSRQIKLESFILNDSGTSIQDAERIVAVGRGIKRPENLPMIHRLAELLGAKVGGSREVVDRGWIDYSNQIGLSGKTVTPRLYIAIGISGAIQHLAGMQTSETIVAINPDADAPIFKVADFGIIGDFREVVPEWIARLEKEKS